MNKFIKFLAIASISILTFACDDEETSQPECTEGVTQCADSAVVQTCVNGRWVANACAYGCADGECKDANATACSYNYKCDGDVLKTCYDMSDYGMGVVEEAENCKDYGLACVETTEEGETYAKCLKPCNTVGENTAMCIDEFLGSYETTGICTDFGNGNKYLLEDEDAAFKVCPSVCDQPNNKCLIFAQDEGQPCDPNIFVERCENGAAIYCNDGIVTASACDDGMTCKIHAEKKVAACVTSCATEAETTAVCDNSYYESHEVEYLYTYQCAKATDGTLNSFMTNIEMCSSCQTNTCTITDADLGTTLKEGDVCNLNLFQNRCADGNALYTCKADYESLEYVVTKTPCQNSCQVAVVNNQKAAACAQETCTTVASTDLACASPESGGSYLTTRTCMATESGTNYYFVTNAEECLGKCDEATKACISIHPDQGNPCDDTYADNCKDNVLAYCYHGTVVTLACDDIPGTSCQISQKLNGYGDCVETCTTPTDIAHACRYDEDYETNDVYSEVCEQIGNASYAFYAWEYTCNAECNANKTDCAE